MRKPVIYILILALAACFIYTLPAGGPQPATEGLLRLHVVASSDSRRPGAELQVKDRIVREIGGLVSEMKTKEEILEFCKEYAYMRIQPPGRRYKRIRRKSRSRILYFPTKSYGSLALPAGDYQPSG